MIIILEVGGTFVNLLKLINFQLITGVGVSVQDGVSSAEADRCQSHFAR